MVKRTFGLLLCLAMALSLVTAASLYGANTTVPFRASSLRCAEGNGWLYIRTSHEMYKSSDGRNHQSSLMIALRQSDMQMMEGGAMDVTAVGYVSHSFNQFVLVDSQDRIVFLDHGDTYPRSLLLQRDRNNAGADRFSWYCDEATLVTFPGAVGNNTTGCSVGGFAEPSSGYAAVYSYDGMGASRSRELYVDFISKNGLSVSNTAKMSVDCHNFTPALASTGLDGGYVLWQEDASYQSDLLGIKLYYARYDANGNVGAAQTAAGAGQLPSTPSTPSSPVTPSTPSAPSTPTTTSTGVAYANTQTILLDGKSVTLDTYTLKDSAGNLTNYVKLRDLAWYLNGTKAQFSVGWGQDCIYLTTHWRYEANGRELSTPFSGDRPRRAGTGRTKIDLIEQNLSSIVLTDDQGGDYTYFKLRDLGRYLDFNVSYINGQVVVNSNEHYSDAQ